MALLLVEGFEGFGTSTGAAPQPTDALARSYLSVNNEVAMNIETGRLAGYCLEFAANDSRFTTKALTTDDTIIVGFAIKYTVLSDVTYSVQLYDDATWGVNLQLTAAGELAVYRGAVLLGTSSAVITINTWYYIEFKVKCNNTTGTYEVRLNGNNILSASGIDTRAGAHDYHNVAKFSTAKVYTTYLDDIYIADSTGAQNNDFLGNCRVDAILPNGDDTATFNFTSSGGSHYFDVDENPADDDTTYIEDSVTGRKDLYDYAAIPSLGTIKGLEIKTTCRITDGTLHDLIMPIKSGGIESDDSAQTLTSTSYETKTRVSETDPSTAAAWIETNLNIAKFGVKVG